MSQSVLNRFPVSKRCCYCVTLKLGTIIIAGIGILPSCVLMLLYLLGTGPYEEHGVDPAAADVIIHIYAVVGALMLGAHLVLFTAALVYNEHLVLLYQWTCLSYIFIDVCLVMYVTIAAILVSQYKFASVYLLCQVLYWSFIVCLVLPVVNGFRQSIHTVVLMLSYLLFYLFTWKISDLTPAKPVNKEFGLFITNKTLPHVWFPI